MKLLITPTAWAKIITAMEEEKTEVGFMAICADRNNLLRITDVYMPKQENSIATTEFDETDLSNKIEALFIDQQLDPIQTSRIWIHTHPGNGVDPSSTDWDTFDKFSNCSFAVMAIIGKPSAGQAHNKYALLRVKSPLGNIDIKLDVQIDWDASFPIFDKEEWKKHVSGQCTSRAGAYTYRHYGTHTAPANSLFGDDDWDSAYGYLEPREYKPSESKPKDSEAKRTTINATKKPMTDEQYEATLPQFNAAISKVIAQWEAAAKDLDEGKTDEIPAALEALYELACEATNVKEMPISDLIEHAQTAEQFHSPLFATYYDYWTENRIAEANAQLTTPKATKKNLTT